MEKGEKMNSRLHLHVLLFLALGASSTVASANWFDGYQSNENIESTSTPVIIEQHQEEDNSAQVVYPLADYLSAGQYYKNPMDVYFLPQAKVPKAMMLAPSFDVVAREMEQIKQQQIADEHALITYVQDNSKMKVE